MQKHTAALACLFLVACGDRPAADTPPARASIGGIAELDALLQKNRGRGTLVNVWATW